MLDRDFQSVLMREIRMSGTSGDARDGQRELWWVAVGATASGPRALCELGADLQSGVLPRATLVCPVSGHEWLPIEEIAEFRPWIPDSRIPVDDRPQTGSPEPLGSGVPFSHMPEWIRNYATIVSPLLGVLSVFDCGIGEPFPASLPSFLLLLLAYGAELVSRTLIFMGGGRLNRHERSGIPLLRIGIWVNVLMTVLSVLLFGCIWGVLILAFLMDGETMDETLPHTALEAILLVLFFVEVGFQIGILRWLSEQRDHLDSHFTLTGSATSVREA